MVAFRTVMIRYGTYVTQQKMKYRTIITKIIKNCTILIECNQLKPSK